jgi:hypothetical protein
LQRNYQLTAHRSLATHLLSLRHEDSRVFRQYLREYAIVVAIIFGTVEEIQVAMFVMGVRADEIWDRETSLVDMIVGPMQSCL